MIEELLYCLPLYCEEAIGLEMWFSRVTEILPFSFKKFGGWILMEGFRAQHLVSCEHAHQGVELGRAEFCLTYGQMLY